MLYTPETTERQNKKVIPKIQLYFKFVWMEALKFVYHLINK